MVFLCSFFCFTLFSRAQRRAVFGFLGRVVDGVLSWCNSYVNLVVVELFKLGSQLLNALSLFLLRIVHPEDYRALAARRIRKGPGDATACVGDASSTRTLSSTKRDSDEARKSVFSTRGYLGMSPLGLLFRFDAHERSIDADFAQSGGSHQASNDTFGRTSFQHRFTGRFARLFWLMDRIERFILLHPVILFPFFVLTTISRLIRGWLRRRSVRRHDARGGGDPFATDRAPEAWSQIPEREEVFEGEVMTTGLMEDLQLRVILGFDRLFAWLKSIVHCVFDFLANLTPFSLLIAPYDTLMLFAFGRHRREPRRRGLFSHREGPVAESADCGSQTTKAEEKVSMQQKPSIFMRPLHALFNFIQLLTLQRPITVVDQEKCDTRGAAEIIRSAGYPAEIIKVTTSDGYVLDMVRIPRRESRDVVYLQHGVLDSCFAWIANENGLAFRSFDHGADVFMGNFRGSFTRNHKNPSISTEEYWDFSINEYGFRDVPAFLKEIHRVKLAESTSEDEGDVHERRRRARFYLTAIGHSMGAEAILMHVVNSKLRNRPNRLSQIICLAPAGYHEKYPFWWDIIGPVIEIFIAPFFSSFRFPSDVVRYVAARIMQDVRNAPATQRLFQHLMSSAVGSQRSTLDQIPNLTWHLFAGTSVKVYWQYSMQMRTKRFLSYDFGSQKQNQEAYGSDLPIDFMSHYDLIDIPIHFLAGTDDRVIPPANVLTHYNSLGKASPNLAFFKLFHNYGHTDFTLQPTDELFQYVFRILTIAKGARGRRRNDFRAKGERRRRRSSPSDDSMDDSREIGRSMSPYLSDRDERELVIPDSSEDSDRAFQSPTELKS